MQSLGQLTLRVGERWLQAPACRSGRREHAAPAAPASALSGCFGVSEAGEQSCWLERSAVCRLITDLECWNGLIPSRCDEAVF